MNPRLVYIEETVDEWGQKSWKNTVTGEVSWRKPTEVEKPDVVEVNGIGLNDRLSWKRNGDDADRKSPTDFDLTESSQHKSKPSSGDELLSTSGEEFSTTASDGAIFFLQREERRIGRLQRRKRTASLAARKALAFLEEVVSMYHEKMQDISAGGELEDDTPAFVDVQSLRALAAGKDNWKYTSRRERKAAKIRAEAVRIATEKETKVLEEVICMYK